MKHVDSSPWSIQMATEMRALERARWTLRCVGVAGVLIAVAAGGAWWADGASGTFDVSAGVARTGEGHP